MTIGASLILLATGAILTFAVTAERAGIDLQIVGVIPMIIGGLGLLMMNSRRRGAPGAGGPYG